MNDWGHDENLYLQIAAGCRNLVVHHVEWPGGSFGKFQVNFGVTFRNARLVPLWIADEEGFFKKQGLDVKQVNISGGTQGAQMMVSGGVDVSYDDPITCIVSTAGGVPVNVMT